MPRPQRHPDHTLITAAAAAIASRGPAWSLEDVAAPLGLTPAALVKRFGSKRNLLLAVVRSWVASIPDPETDASDPVGALRLLVRQEFAAIEPGSAGAHLGLLLAELGDADVRALVRQGWARQEARYAALIAAAQRRGDLRGPDPVQAAALVAALVQGIALRWSVDPDGPLAARQVAAVDSVLDGWR
jgi:AcrR family transcriptional regulator